MQRGAQGLTPGGTTPACVTPSAPVVGEREDSIWARLQVIYFLTDLAHGGSV